MKSVEDMREQIENMLAFSTGSVSPGALKECLLDILDHIDRLNGRSDIMREVAEGNMIIVRRGEYVAKSFYRQLYRELVALRQAVRECADGRLITVNSIVPRQVAILAHDEEYQAAIRSRMHIDPDISAGKQRRACDDCKYWRPPEARHKECQRLMDRDDSSVSDPIVDRGSIDYIVDRNSRPDPDSYNTEPWLRRGEFPPPPVPAYARTGDSELPTGFGYTVPHPFDLDKKNGLKHTEYRVCKCGLSEFNLIHIREDTNAKTNQSGSQT